MRNLSTEESLSGLCLGTVQYIIEIIYNYVYDVIKFISVFGEINRETYHLKNILSDVDWIHGQKFYCIICRKKLWDLNIPNEKVVFAYKKLRRLLMYNIYCLSTSLWQTPWYLICHIHLGSCREISSILATLALKNHFVWKFMFIRSESISFDLFTCCSIDFLRAICRPLFAFLQGTWFYQIAYTLFNPALGGKPSLDQTDSESVMVVTLYFAVHTIAACACKSTLWV